uniref:Uncharacterized protein n=1 Tax=Ackermannviridae sp. TaxID=2831612 RepID=A0A8S5VXU4_9CAUD|nr:MAG TPA: hypothetical protein [Ackermannviridae sp.]
MAENVIIHEISLSGYKATSDGMLDLGTWGSYGVEKLHCTFDEAWRELTITAFFNVKGEVVGKSLVGKDGYADVPWEATKENTFAGRIVFEGSMNNQRRISANLNFKVTNHSEFEDSDPVPTDDRWNQFVTQNKEYRDGAYEAATKAEARAEDAEAASEDAQAAMRAAKASEDAAADSKNAAKDSEDKAKASADAAARSESNASVSERAAADSAAAAAASEGSAAESAKNAASAAKKAADESVAANISTIKQIQSDVTAKQNNAAASATAAAASAKAASDSAAAAKASENAAAKSATDAEGYKNTASTAAQNATAAANSSYKNATSAADSAREAAGYAKTASDAAAVATDAKADAVAAQEDAAASKTAAANSAAAAKASESAAAKSEANAKQSADTLAESVENVAANTAAVAELKEKKAEIDDSAVGADGWSSKHIVDMLCPKIEESGNPVQCYPVSGYPLGVKASWEPTQEGSGDPSPENIRPIKGRTEVKVERCGKNLLKNKGNKTISGIEWTFDDQGLISIKGTIRQNLSDYFFWGETVENSEAFTTHVDLVLSSNYITNDSNCIFGVRSDAGLLQNGGRLNRVSIPSGTRIYGVFMRVLNATVDYSGIYAQLELGSTVTPYAPYIGQTNTLTLPETVYGGEVDAVRGEGQETWKLLTLDGTENWKYDDRSFFICTLTNRPKSMKAMCDRYDGTYASNANALYVENRNLIIGVNTCGFTELNDFIDYLVSQYAAGTPVQICYKPREPVPFTATGAQPLPALAGLNTVLTNADSVTVTVRADPIKRITDLEDAVASQT